MTKKINNITHKEYWEIKNILKISTYILIVQMLIAIGIIILIINNLN